MQEYERSFSFTANAERCVTKTVEDLAFPEKDADMIFETLKNGLRVVPFSDYLKRYIYQQSGMFGSFREVPISSYAATIIEAFHETGTPSSLKHARTKLNTRVNDWLRETSVRRDVVLLLGFGLSMREEEVNWFLTMASHDHELDPEDPLEAICAYCYQRQYGYAKMEQLLQVYQNAESVSAAKVMIEQNQPARREASRKVIAEDMALIKELIPRREYHGITAQKERTRFHFARLYRQAGEMVSARMKDGKGTVTPRDIEEMLCATIPRDHHGNLIPEMGSEVRAWMAGKRFSRQHLHLLLHGEAEPSRYDLISLRFLICSGNLDAEQGQGQDPRTRYRSFLQDMNHILTDCGFGRMYAADPYESFILMCLLSEDPLTAYSDVVEMSYAPQADGDA